MQRVILLVMISSLKTKSYLLKLILLTTYLLIKLNISPFLIEILNFIYF